jgi:tetratricopeptide (TPR) repeat protein
MRLANRLAARRDARVPQLLKSAVDDLDAALRAHPGDAATWAIRAETRRGMAMWEQRSGRPHGPALEEALKDADEAVRLESAAGHFEVRGALKYEIATALSDDRASVARLEEAIADFGEVVRLAPSNTAAWTRLGDAHEHAVHRMVSRREAADAFATAGQAAYAQALKLDPDRVAALVGRAALRANWGISLARAGKPGAQPAFAGAVEDAVRATELAPEDAEPWRMRSHTSYLNAKFEKGRGLPAGTSCRDALASADRAVALDPSMAPKLRSAREWCEACLREE